MTNKRQSSDCRLFLRNHWSFTHTIGINSKQNLNLNKIYDFEYVIHNRIL